MIRGIRPRDVGIVLAISLGSAIAHAQTPESPVAVCPPSPGPITVDGRLDEWTAVPAIDIGESHLVRADPKYMGAADLSARIHVARDATTLYVAGRIQDDTLFWNPHRDWLGDGVELFFDFHPELASRDPAGGYDEYAHQLLLHPLASEVRWSFATLRGAPGRMDDPVDGLRLAGLPMRDEKGATVGYTFELALPLHNLTDQVLEAEREIGFDVALSDSDGQPEQKNYATWSRNERIHDVPARFGRLRMGAQPAVPERVDHRAFSPTAPLAVLIAVLGALLFLWLGRMGTPAGRRLLGALDALRRIRLRPKLVTAGTLVLLVAVAEIAAGWASSQLTDRDVAEHRDLTQQVRAIAAEADALRLLDARDQGPTEPLIALLGGGSLAAPVDYTYRIVPPVAEVPHRTLEGTPFLRRDIPALSSWAGSFQVHPPTRTYSATLIYSWRREPGRDVLPASGDAVAELRFVHADARVAPPTVLRFGRHVDAADAPIPDGALVAPDAPDARVAFVTSPVDGPALHACQLDVDVALDGAGGRLVRIEVEQQTTIGTFVLHGITLHGEAGQPPRMLRLARPAQSGLPTGASPFPSAEAVLELSAENDWVVLRDLDLRTDRIWIVAALRAAYPSHRYRSPVALIEAVFDDGSVDGPFPLANGVSIAGERTPVGQLTEDEFQSETAFEWGLPGDRRHHFDVTSLPLEQGGRRLRELQLQFTGETEVVRIAGVTIGAVAEAAAPAETQLLELGPDGYRLPESDRAALAGASFTLYRGGAAVATTLPGDTRERALARRLGTDELARVREQSEGAHESRIIDGQRMHSLFVSAPGEGPDGVLEMSWRSGADTRLRDLASLVRGILSVLLAPVLVLLAADLIARLHSLHARFVAAFAVAASVPVVLAAFAVPQLVGSKIEGVEEEAVLGKSAAVKRHLASLRSLARRRAEDALRDAGLQEALRRRDAEDFRAGVADALRDIEHGVSASSGGEARVVLEDARTDGSAEPMVIPEQSRYTVFASRTVNITDVLAYRWSRLYASGVAKAYDTSGERKTTLVVELPLERPTLHEAARAAGGGAEVLLYTPRGFPLAATLETEGEEQDSERLRKRQILDRVLLEQRPLVEPLVLQGSLYTVAYDVLREGTEPVCVVATALPRAGTESLLRRVEGVSILVFGAGILMQFLLTGLVVGGTSRRFQRALGRAQLATPALDRDGDELARLDGAVRELRRDRELYRTEIAQLHEIVDELGVVHAPEEVVATALAAVRRAIAPWGAVVISVRDDGRPEVLGGFRGEDDVPLGPAPLAGDGPLRGVLLGEGDARVTREDLKDDAPEATLLGGAARAHAFALGGTRGPGGALVLLDGEEGRSRDFHPTFAAALARHTGLALASTRLVRLAVRDPESGAYVAAYFARRLAEEVDRAAATRHPIALLLVAAEGMGIGDTRRQRRVRLASILHERAPGRAFVGVVDDGLLAVAVPESDRATAEALARDLRRNIAERGLPDVTLEVGIAACPEDAGSSEFLLAEARRRLRQPGEPKGDPPRLADRQQRLIEDARALGVVFRSPKGVHLLETVERIAASDLTILIEGETGTGKEVIAELIHKKSGRGSMPLVKVNCAALPESLLESELFGYEPGAFTGADRRKPGRFELANGGTLFLDEIGEMTGTTQVKLLRVLEDHVVETLGGTQPLPIDVRVVVATNRDLRREVAEGRFREDLFYRLNAISVVVPPLRARKDDIPALVDAFVARAADAHGRRKPEIAPDAMDLLYRHPWPGNVRELRNAIEQAVVLAPGEILRTSDLRPALRASTARRTGPIAAGSPAARRAPDGLSDRQRRVLALLAEREWVTNTEYCELVGISTRTGLRDLRDLMARGLLAMEGKRRGARYRLP